MCDSLPGIRVEPKGKIISPVIPMWSFWIHHHSEAEAAFLPPERTLPAVLPSITMQTKLWSSLA